MTQADARKIIETIDAFALEMKARMFAKIVRDWDDPGSLDALAEELASRVGPPYSGEKVIDIANLAMMLWYHSDDEWSKRINSIKEKLNASYPIDCEQPDETSEH